MDEKELLALLELSDTRLIIDFVKKELRISYLEGLLTHNIWADFIPNGNQICDNLEDELKKLRDGK